ncbi:MAG TPA: c-type cytochrome [Candidatus Acidoferrales bacterium]|nr:c-type cytochrome [Candidatus Acidoferrales bacterium]
MRNFILGIIFTLVVLALGAVCYTRLGLVNVQADQPPSSLERWFLGGASDAAVERNAPNIKNPVPATEENVVAGAQLYANDCEGCHGTPSDPNIPFSHSLNPPAPRFFVHAPDMPENQNFYIAKHGLRWTGMPAWGKTLSDQQIWQIVTFLSNVEKLPPAAKKVLEPSSTPPSGPPAR